MAGWEGVEFTTRLRGLLSGESEWQPMVGGKIKPDVVWSEGSLVYPIFQLEDGLGLGSDPSLQSLIAYSTIDEVTSPFHSCQLQFH